MTVLYINRKDRLYARALDKDSHYSLNPPPQRVFKKSEVIPIPSETKFDSVTLLGHSNKDENKMEGLSPQELAEKLRPHLKKGAKLYLISCEVGFQENGKVCFAQQLANKLKDLEITVHAITSPNDVNVVGMRVSADINGNVTAFCYGDMESLDADNKIDAFKHDKKKRAGAIAAREDLCDNKKYHNIPLVQETKETYKQVFEAPHNTFTADLSFEEKLSSKAKEVSDNVRKVRTKVVTFLDPGNPIKPQAQTLPEPSKKQTAASLSEIRSRYFVPNFLLKARRIEDKQRGPLKKMTENFIKKTKNLDLNGIEKLIKEELAKPIPAENSPYLPSEQKFKIQVLQPLLYEVQQVIEWNKQESQLIQESVSNQIRPNSQRQVVVTPSVRDDQKKKIEKVITLLNEQIDSIGDPGISGCITNLSTSLKNLNDDMLDEKNFKKNFERHCETEIARVLPLLKEKLLDRLITGFKNVGIAIFNTLPGTDQKDYLKTKNMQTKELLTQFKKNVRSALNPEEKTVSVVPSRTLYS